MRNLEKRHFLTSLPVPDPDFEMMGGGGGGGFFPPFGPQFRPKISGGGGGGALATDDYALP